jgi:biotin transport system substrate-specific component
MQQFRALTLNPSIAVSSAAVVGVALLTALCAQISIHIPGTPVPQTLQTFAVLGGTAYLGARRGVASMGLYVAMGLFLPVYAGGAQGWSAATGASGGYLAGFIVAGYATGLMRERLGWSSIRGTIPSMLVGSVCVYVPGLIWLHHEVPGTTWSWAIHWGLTVFIIGDLIKILGASAVLNPKAPWGGLFDRIRLF